MDEVNNEEVNGEETIIEEQKPSLLKKIIIAVLGTFLLILILSYFLFPSNIFSILAGFIESSKLIGTNIKIDKNTNLIFNEASLNTLNELYNKNLLNEFKVCLKGKVINNTYYIEETIQPKTFLQEYNKVIAEPCSEEDLVDLHTHPFKQCLPSDIDIKNFQRFEEKNKNALMAVMCEKDRFNFYK